MRYTLSGVAVFFFTVVSFLPYFVSGQKWIKEVDNNFYEKYYHGSNLREGDKMPDVTFEAIFNDELGLGSIKQLRGKLIIFDVWNTGCDACIASFPKLEQLQSHFGDKLQIILVNPHENANQLLDKINKGLFRMPNLPTIVPTIGSKKINFLKYFPTISLGTQIWINKDGIIVLRGGSANATKDKIGMALSGIPIPSTGDINSSPIIIRDISTSPDFNTNIPLYKLLNNFPAIPPKIISFISPFNTEYAVDPTVSVVLNKVDSSAGTIRNSFINMDILDIIRSSINMYRENKNVLLIATSDNEKSPPMDYIRLYTKDSSRYSRFFRSENNSAEKKYVNKICYEQIMPNNIKLEERTSFMLEDLTRYYHNLYGTTFKLIKEKTPCYTLTRISVQDEISTNQPDGMRRISVQDRSKKYSCYGLASFINQSIRDIPSIFHQLGKGSAIGISNILINETGFSNQTKVDITIPYGEGISIDDYKIALQKYGLDLIVKEQEITYLVIQDDSWKPNENKGTEVPQTVGKVLSKNIVTRTDENNEINLAKKVSENKLTLIDFWASWCVPCRQEHPALKELYSQYKDKGFEIVSVSIDQNRETWKKAFTADKLPWQQLIADRKGEEDVANFFGVTGVPARVLINQSGEVVAYDLPGSSFGNDSKSLRGENLNKQVEQFFRN